MSKGIKCRKREEGKEERRRQRMSRNARRMRPFIRSVATMKVTLTKMHKREGYACKGEPFDKALTSLVQSRVQPAVRLHVKHASKAVPCKTAILYQYYAFLSPPSISRSPKHTFGMAYTMGWRVIVALREAVGN